MIFPHPPAPPASNACASIWSWNRHSRARTNRHLRRAKHISVVVLLLPLIALADCEIYWDVSTLADSQYANHQFQNGKNTIATIPTSWFRQIKKIKQKIDTSSGMYTKLFVCNSDDQNAYATKDKDTNQNLVAVSLGMYRLLGNDWDAYAALLGHENAHLVKNHGRKQSSRELGVTIIKVLAGIALETFIVKETDYSSGFGFDVADFGAATFNAFYSRKEEREADSFGMTYARRAGFDPHGAIRLHSKLNSSSNFLSTHPSSSDRIARLYKEIAKSQPVTTNTSTTQPSTTQPSTTQPNTQSTSLAAASAAASHHTTTPSAGGLVIMVKGRHRYYIASRTSLVTPQKGMKTYLITPTYTRINGTVERVVGDFFSVLTNAPLDESILYRQVIFR